MATKKKLKTKTKRKSIRTKEAGLGRERVKAWVVTVINPVLEGLYTELYYLHQKNWTWRFTTGGFDYISSIAGYIDIRYHPNFEDFCRKNPNIKKLIDEHDVALDTLARVLKGAYTFLLTSGVFKQRFNEAIFEYHNRGLEPKNPWGAYPEEEGPKVVVQYLINNIQELDSSYTTAVFWREYGLKLREVLKDPDIEPLIKNVKEKGMHVKKIAAQIEESLKALRSDYADRFGIPPVPIEDEEFGPEWET